MNKKENFFKGFVKENPIFVFLLGMCPALAVTATFETALGMGLLVVFVLTMSNIVISSVRKWIPYDLRTPSFIVIIATFVTIVRMFTFAYSMPLYEALGVFIPLIVVNCLILGRAEAFASKNNVLDSAIDGLGMGLGFTLALVIIGIFREFAATGGIMYGVYLEFFVNSPITLFSIDWILHLVDGGFAINTFDLSIFRIQDWETSYNISDYTLNMFGLAPGAFIALGIILAFMQGKTTRRVNKEIAAKKALIAEKKRIALDKKKKAAIAAAKMNNVVTKEVA